MVKGMNLGNNNDDEDKYEFDEYEIFDDEDEDYPESGKQSRTGMKIFKGVVVLSGVSLVLMIGMQFFGDSDTAKAPDDYGVEYVHDVEMPEGVEFDEDEELIYTLADEYMIYEPFSKAGLVEHMSMNETLASDKIEGTVEYLDVDWNEAAVRAVRRYVETFASDADAEGLRSHLEYEQFTEDEIAYATENTDLDALIAEVEEMYEKIEAEMQEEAENLEEEDTQSTDDE